MKTFGARMSVAFSAATLAAFFLLSCSPFGPGDPKPEAQAGSGTSLVRYGARLYLAGGRDRDGNSLPSVRSAVVGNDGRAGDFEAEPGLPQGLSFASFVASGFMFYCLGGETAPALPVSAIRYTYINADGTLGFGNGVYWERNEIPLPEPRSRAAVLINDGWIYLFGGLTGEGEATGSILRARVYRDGQVGSWYPAADLPSPRSRTAAAILDGRLYIAGGVGSSEEYPLSEVVSFTLGAYGALGDRRTEHALPKGLFGAAVIAEGENLLVAGGYSASGTASSSVYSLSGAGWTRLDGISLGVDGPSAGRAAGSLWYLPQGFANDPAVETATPSRYAALNLSPEAPQALPGSGRVPQNSLLRFRPEPGSVVRYEKNGSTVTETSPEYSFSSPPSATSIALKAFGCNGKNSPESRYEYLPVNLGFFVNVSEDLTPDMLSAVFPGYRDLAMRESTTDRVAYPDGFMPASSEWFRLSIGESGTYFLRLADAETNAETGKSYTGRISVSLVERDLMTEVPDAMGNKVSDIVPSNAGEIDLWLQAGTYYLRAEDADGLSGRTFGLLVSRR